MDRLHLPSYCCRCCGFVRSSLTVGHFLGRSISLANSFLPSLPPSSLPCLTPSLSLPPSRKESVEDRAVFLLRIQRTTRHKAMPPPTTKRKCCIVCTQTLSVGTTERNERVRQNRRIQIPSRSTDVGRGEARAHKERERSLSVAQDLRMMGACHTSLLMTRRGCHTSPPIQSAKSLAPLQK